MTQVICTACGNIMEKEGNVTDEVYFPNRRTWADGNINVCPCHPLSDQTVIYGRNIVPVTKGMDGVWYGMWMKPMKNGELIAESNVLAEAQYKRINK